jgi:hypothetical protein
MNMTPSPSPYNIKLHAKYPVYHGGNSFGLLSQAIYLWRPLPNSLVISLPFFPLGHLQPHFIDFEAKMGCAHRLIDVVGIFEKKSL